MIINYIGLTDKGRVRTHNEDSYLANGKIFTSLDKGGEDNIKEIEIGDSPVLFAVADGIGGHEGGEVASNMALELLKEKIHSIPGENPVDFIRNVIHEIHKEVLRMGIELKKRGMGTTLTGCTFDKERFLTFHVGDSRIYRFRSDYISQLTRDHSLKEEMRSDTVPKNIITSCIGGGSDDIRIDVTDSSGKITRGDIFFLMSDGIVDSLTDDDLETCLTNKEKSLQEVLEEILLLSLDRGSTDNVTGILIRVKEG